MKNAESGKRSIDHLIEKIVSFMSSCCMYPLNIITFYVLLWSSHNTLNLILWLLFILNLLPFWLQNFFILIFLSAYGWKRWFHQKTFALYLQSLDHITFYLRRSLSKLNSDFLSQSDFSGLAVYSLLSRSSACFKKTKKDKSQTTKPKPISQYN